MNINTIFVCLFHLYALVLILLLFNVRPRMVSLILDFLNTHKNRQRLFWCERMNTLFV